MPPLDSEIGGALSVDEAATLLSTPPEKKEEPEETAEVEETEQSETETEPVEGDAEEQPEAETEEEPAVETVAVEAPHFWSAEHKAEFAKLPPELQAIVLDQEKNREGAVTRAQQQAAEARKKAETEASQAAQFTAALNELLPRAAQTFASKWERVDWKAWADTDPEAAFRGRVQMEQEQRELQQLQAAKQVADAQSYSKFVAEEEEKLKTIAPDLTHPEKGKGLRIEVGKYLIEHGATEQELKNADARILGIAYKAYKWDQAQAKAQAQARSQPSAAPKLQTKSVVKPTASAATRSPNQARAEQLSKKRTLSVEEATELYMLKGK